MKKENMEKLNRASIELLYDLNRHPMTKYDIVQQYNGRSKLALQELEDAEAIRNISKTGEPLYTVQKDARGWLDEQALKLFGAN
jgi:hypothetical protein